ncbi:double-cubane-cluster-containing anaerobic reductase [Desulfobacula toluolica]|uniref:HgdB2: predicted 2-hydroxyglutaryl-CoA dehydratase, beta subunit n=1 Tax=Desulfobacula toluolica (strain DSM 7467 / Tol2) TaxID=651182 RepID=K0NNB3_DESTT|nr:double-cubane-cluster-containing anaerobic reductase [Desulfobacula toluolica]CCK82110.1 HgdB2: predicted 2-hydroxyglutaryl-CoA dehydratase, beta subunit [Desulfobacula toluolica Tol2]
MELSVTQTIQDLRTDLAMELEMAKDEGKKVVGCLCSYTPIELILAAGAIPVGLCGSTQTPILAAEEVLSPDQCPKVKATYGRAISGTCPLFPLADCIISETTCDGRKKMYELLAREVPLLVMDLPQKPDEQEALTHWIAEVDKAKSFLEHQLDVVITSENLRDAIQRGNRRRHSLTRLFMAMGSTPPPVTGVEFMEIMSKIGHYVDYDKHINLLSQLLQTLEKTVTDKISQVSTKRHRILWTGLGNSLGCSKVLELVEESGGVVVCQEGCGGITRTEDLIDETKDPLHAIAERYLRVTCACMTPNAQRFKDLKRLIQEFKIDGVIDLAWQFCQPFEIESYRVGELVKKEMGLPFLHIVTDFSQSDVEQLRVRIEGFIEQISENKKYARH